MDYSEAWQRAVEESAGNVEACDILLKCLYKRRINPKAPPNFPPPTSEEDVSDAASVSSRESGLSWASVNSQNSSNSFSLLSDDDEVLITRRDNPRITAAESKEEARYASIQFRYLIKKVEDCYAVSLRSRAVTLLRTDSTEYGFIARLWNQCYQVLNDALIGMDNWTAYKVQADESNTRQLPDNHDYARVSELLDCLMVDRDDTEDMRLKALHTLRLKEEKLDAELERQRKERDAVRAKLGSRWTENRGAGRGISPKAKLFNDLSKIAAELKESISVIEDLRFRSN